MEVGAMFFRIVLLYFLTVYIRADPSSCGSLLPTTEMKYLGEQGSLFPDSDQLSDICPGFLSFSRCFRSALQDTPEDFDEDSLAIYHSLDDSFGDLCSEDSELRRSYLSNMECLKSVEDEWQTCLNTSANVYTQYKTNNEENFLRGEENCFKRGYAVGCMSERIFDACGQNATSVYQLFMRKYRYVSGQCTAPAAEELRTKFLEYLKLSADRKDIFQDAFDSAF